ncbi:MAG: hypothetical protein L0H73_02605 [Nitrococcus sp.]|nr:hypothetical protein [Nitrococcus sp.]
MESGTLLTLWAGSAALSLLIWAILAVGVLYLARNQAHTLIQVSSRLLIRQLRHVSRRLIAAAALVRRANRSYLLALARERASRSLNYEFHGVALGVERDLATFPALYQRLSEQIARVDQDYRESADPPPRPPEWLEAIASLTRGPERSDPAVQRVLEDLNNTLDRAAHQALLEYRAAHRRRYRLLARMPSHWRMVEHRLGSLEATIAELNRRSRRIDRAMLRFRQTRRPETCVKRIANAAAGRFLIAIAMLAAAIPAAIVAFELIARPIAEITAGIEAVAGVPFYNVAAAAMLITEVVAGSLVLESMAVTRMLPAVTALEPQMRNRLRVTATGIFLLTVFAAGALAWTRDYLIGQDIVLVELLQAGQISFPGPEFHWIPALAHSVLAFSLGFLLGALAIPLESALQNGRLVLGSLLALSLSGAGELCRLGALLCWGLGRFLTRVYDLAILLPLRLEAVGLRAWRNRIAADAAYPDESADKVAKVFEKRQRRRWIR